MKHKVITGIVLALLLASTLTLTFRLWIPPMAKAETAHVTFEFSEVITPSGDTRELAVAFHSITFLDVDANLTGEILFGTPEANSLQEEGWFGNEEWPGLGSFQWAGSSSRRASMRLPIPEETEGLLLYINSIVDGVGMNVTIEGLLIAVLRVDAYWHREYVPVDDPIPTPRGEPEWVEEHYFPRFPAVDKVYSIHVDSALADWWGAPSTRDWRITDSYDTMMALTLVGMQGVINQNGACIYLDWEDAGKYDDPSGFWLSQISNHVEVVNLGLEGIEAINFLFQRYGTRFNGAVIYDPEVPDTINLATMLAGLENRIILAPEQIGLPGIPIFENVTDLRGLVDEHGWDTSEEGRYKLYNWIYENLWPNLEHRIIGVISPGPPITVDEDDRYIPLGMAARDYIVALRLPALWISPVDEPQAGLFAQFLEDSPSPIPVFGFFGNNEEETVALASSYGNWVPVITIGNCPLTCGSLTVLSSIRPSLKRYEAEMDVDRIFSTFGEKPVAMIWSSDGDSLQLQYDRGIHGPIFKWEELQDHRFGWSMNPTLADIAPIIWNYYMESRSEASFVCGYSGAGYCYPHLMDGTELEKYLNYTAHYLDETGLRVVWVDPRYSQDWSIPGLFNELANPYYEYLGHSGYVGSLVGAGSLMRWGLGFSYANTPAPLVSASYGIASASYAEMQEVFKEGEWIIQDLLNRNSDEVFVDIASYPWHGGHVVEDGDALNGKAILFSHEDPDCGLVVSGPEATLAPGNYTVTFRLKVPTNIDTKSVALLYVGIAQEKSTAGEDWSNIALHYISPSDFDQANEYENFTLVFTLEQMTQGVEFRIDYYGGLNPPPGTWASTDLFADYITATKDDSLGLPVFASVIIVVTNPDFEMSETPQFAENLQLAGGITLQPDEFFAALNPEFMIEWGTPILGSEHPALDEARQQLVEGEFLTSLLTIREALRTLPEHSYQLHFEEKDITYEVSILGNTWITPLEYDEAGRQIELSTHGPPEGTVQAFVTIPNELQDGLTVVNIDDQPHTFASSHNETHTIISLQFDQGPHDVEIPLPALAPPDITYVYQTPATDNIMPEDEVKVDATVVDPNGVKRVVLNYTYTNSSGTLTVVVNMTNLEGNVWNATIPAFPYGTNVTYGIIAEDNINNAITTEEMGYEYGYNVIPEFPSLFILPLFILLMLIADFLCRRKRST